MAYMDQDKKRKIKAALTDVVPMGWKYTLSVHNRSTLIMTIRSAPVDLMAVVKKRSAEVARQRNHEDYTKDSKYLQLNDKHLDLHFEGELLQTMQKIVNALNTDNHDRSDSMTDYFDVGHYIDINIGRWDNLFVCTE